MSSTSFIYIGAGVGAIAELACNVVCICLIIRAAAKRRTHTQHHQPQRRSGHGPDIRTRNGERSFQHAPRNATTAQTNVGIQQETPRNYQDSNLMVEPPPSYIAVSSSETTIYPHAMGMNDTLPQNATGDVLTTLCDDQPPPYNPQSEVSSSETTVYPHAMAVNATLPQNETGDVLTTLCDDQPPPYNPQSGTQTMTDYFVVGNGNSGDEPEDRQFEGDSTQESNVAGSNLENEGQGNEPRDTQQISINFN